MKRILSSDILIADVIIPLAGNPALAEMVERYQLQPGGKTILDDEQMKVFSAAVQGQSFDVVPGGSSANMLTTLARILGGGVTIDFFGVAGEGAYGELIKHSLTDAGIILWPGLAHFHHQPTHCAVSFVFVAEDGQCTIATHSGNARDIVKPAMITEHAVERCDILLAQGSLWRKLPTDFVDRLYRLCVKYDKQLWLTLPTQAHLNAAEAEAFMAMIPDANVVFGNEGELTRLYDVPLEEALTRLQRVLRKNQRAAHHTARPPVGFITLGKDGAVVVGVDRIVTIAPEYAGADAIVNTLGAGDTSYAGFAAGYLSNMPDGESARMAMILAGEKLRISGPRLADPRAILEKTMPDSVKLFV